MGSRPTTYSVIYSATVFIAEEMGVVLRRASYSPNIKDRMDFSCAVMSPQGQLVAQAEHIPVHLGSMAVGVKSVLQEVERLGVSLEQGDVLLVNDPYLAGTHLNDIMLLKPVFHDGEVTAILANKAHHVDVGGSVPGSLGGEVEEIMQEGIVVPPVKLVERGRLQEEIIRLLESNVRTPEYLRGDLKAQIASLTVGERLLKSLLEKYGKTTVVKAWQHSLSYVESYMRKVLSELKAYGSSSAIDYIEVDDRLVEIKAKVTIDRERVIVDFTGTSSQVRAPVNAVYGVTVASTLFAVKSALDPEMPMNHGFEKVVSVIAPRGTVVNPVKPAPVSAGNVETSQRIVDVVLRAMANLVPDRIPAASCGSMNNIAVGGISGGRQWAFYETVGGGAGGRPGKDGVDGVHTHMTNTLNTPIEVLEREYPVLFLEYKLRENSEGPGKYRGGLGIVRSFMVLESGVRVAITGERVKTRPYGLAGGKPGMSSEYLVVRGSGETVRLSSKSIVRLSRGDVVVVKTAGGGGYGNPCERSRELVEKDLIEGKISIERAVSEYCYDTATSSRKAQSTSPR